MVAALIFLSFVWTESWQVVVRWKEWIWNWRRETKLNKFTCSNDSSVCKNFRLTRNWDFIQKNEFGFSNRKPTLRKTTNSNHELEKKTPEGPEQPAASTPDTSFLSFQISELQFSPFNFSKLQFSPSNFSKLQVSPFIFSKRQFSLSILHLEVHRCFFVFDTSKMFRLSSSKIPVPKIDAWPLNSCQIHKSRKKD